MRPLRGLHGMEAHPRSRGENHLSASALSSAKGSSPLTRGKHHVDSPAHHILRLIPAHAGKTYFRPRIVRPYRAHPRSRGENARARGYKTMCMGSSPLTRGKLYPLDTFTEGSGLIPAHAGKTNSSILRRIHTGAHPRSRGENREAATAWFEANGSSPLTRGKPSPRGRRSCRARLIPAHAGKTPTCTPRYRARWAHPRSRGENFEAFEAFESHGGSSPLTRGKPCSRVSATLTSGLIPAHAGKTGASCVAPRIGAAHPRSRGENAGPLSVVSGGGGSSPLTRGKR